MCLLLYFVYNTYGHALTNEYNNEYRNAYKEVLTNLLISMYVEVSFGLL